MNFSESIFYPLFCLFFVLFSFSLSAQQEELLGMELLPEDTGKVYKVVEKMPLFLNADELETNYYPEMKSAADRAMLDYVYGELEYPEEDLNARTEGMAVVSFIVERDGRITSVATARHVSPTIDAEALRVVDLMAWELPFWEPGYQDGVPVRVEFNLPIKFRVPNSEWRRGRN